MNARRNFWRLRANPWRNSWKFTEGLSGQILGVSHVVISLVVMLGEFFEEILEESFENLVRCNIPVRIRDGILGGNLGLISGRIHVGILKEIFGIMPGRILR